MHDVKEYPRICLAASIRFGIVANPSSDLEDNAAAVINVPHLSSKQTSTAAAFPTHAVSRRHVAIVLVAPGEPSDLPRVSFDDNAMLRHAHPTARTVIRPRVRQRKVRVAKPKMFQRTPPPVGVSAGWGRRTRTNFLHAVIFDVEGTLVDAALPTLRCWQETLFEFGFSFTTAELHRYSGLGGDEMLQQLLPAAGKFERSRILNNQADRYRTSLFGGYCGIARGD